MEQEQQTNNRKYIKPTCLTASIPLSEDIEEVIIPTVDKLTIQSNEDCPKSPLDKTFSDYAANSQDMSDSLAI